ncbi:tyrosine-protein phosphatase non-receptor type 12-like, partial [Saccoglossus kowalevskii]
MTAQDNLQSFIERVQLMRDGLKSGNDTFALEFQELKLKSARYKLEKSSKIGELECNTRKNRYRDILP